MELEKEVTTELCPRCGSILYTIGCYQCSNNSCCFRWNEKDFHDVKAAMELLNWTKEIKQLEHLSDKVRHGTPIDYRDAVAVVFYQSELSKHRKPSLITRFKLYLNKLIKR